MPQMAGGELRLRVLSALFLAPLALAAELAGSVPFGLLVAAVAGIALWEWAVMTDAAKPLWAQACVLVCLVAGLLAFALGTPEWGAALIGIPALLTLALGLISRAFLWLGIGLLYVGIPCAGLILLRQAEPSGWAAVLFVIFVVWATDIAAYFGGRSFGGPKLWARVSPKKTWSGALTGLFAALCAGGLTASLTGAGDWRLGVLIAAPLSIVSQLGDLLESALKRHFGAKDSGHVIPGHGGVLDRLDGLFAAAALALLIAAAGWGGSILSMPASGPAQIGAG